MCTNLCTNPVSACERKEGRGDVKWFNKGKWYKVKWYKVKWYKVKWYEVKWYKVKWYKGSGIKEKKEKG